VVPERQSQLQRHILTWLVALGFDTGNVSTSLKGLKAKGLVTITRTPGGKAEAVDLTAAGRKRVAALTASGD
jgi:DNA-binding MarR family transcriptional regulator